MKISAVLAVLAFFIPAFRKKAVVEEPEEVTQVQEPRRRYHDYSVRPARMVKRGGERLGWEPWMRP